MAFFLYLYMHNLGRRNTTCNLKGIAFGRPSVRSDHIPRNYKPNACSAFLPPCTAGSLPDIFQFVSLPYACIARSLVGISFRPSPPASYIPCSRKRLFVPISHVSPLGPSSFPDIVFVAYQDSLCTSSEEQDLYKGSQIVVRFDG